MRAYFSIHGDTFDVDAVAVRMGISGATIRKKGEQRRPTGPILKATSWQIRTEELPTRDVHEAVSAMFAMLAEHVELIEEVVKELDLATTLLVVTHGSGRSHVIGLTTDHVRTLGRLRGSFSVDFTY